MVATLAEARSHNVPPDVFRRHYRDIRDAKDAHAETGMALARLKKAAKSDGIDLDAFKMLEKLGDLDTDEALMQLRHLRLYALWTEKPFVTQLDMFGQPEPKPDDGPDDEHKEWEMADAGSAAGKAGHTRDTNPNQAGSALHVAWDRAWKLGNKEWLKGQKQIAGEMGKRANGATPPAGRKRGRAAEAEAPAH
jgi:hypothetical protein